MFYVSVNSNWGKKESTWNSINFHISQEHWTYLEDPLELRWASLWNTRFHPHGLFSPWVWTGDLWESSFQLTLYHFFVFQELTFPYSHIENDQTNWQIFFRAYYVLTIVS